MLLEHHFTELMRNSTTSVWLAQMQEAVAEVNRLCEERGFLQDDGSVYLPTNNAFIVTATA